MTAERGHVQIDWYDRETGKRGRFDEREDYGGYGGSVWRDETGRWDLFMWQDGNYACDCNRSLFFLGSENERGCAGKSLVIEALSVWPAGDGPLEATGYQES
jgi:hypothetical protein